MRYPVFGEDVVATSHPLAAQAGLRMLQSGGNAVDAALAAAIALVVVEPVSTGLGSDGFALVFDGETLHGINGSGRAPRGWTDAVVKTWKAMPTVGWGSVTVPGIVAMWADLSQRFGALPFERLFEPAVAWAARGHPVAPNVADRWRIQLPGLLGQPGFAEAYAPAGRAPEPGETVRFPDLAASLQDIAETKGRSFYQGRLAEAVAAHAAAFGGSMTLDDLAAHRSEWSATISRPFLGADIHEMPPNGQGVVVLMALGMLESFDWNGVDLSCALSLHRQIEAFKLAAADVASCAADGTAMLVSVDRLLDPAYLRSRAALITDRAQEPSAGLPVRGGTVYVTAADRSGRLVSLIQSNFAGFGSGVVVPGTGISFHNRAASFTFDPNHPNRPLGGKRPLHSIMPAMAMRNGMPLMSLGVTGGNMQPQGQIQLLLRILAGASDPQAAIDAPRYRLMANLDINLEPEIHPQVAADLAARGHRIKPLPPDYMDFGSAQIAHRVGDAWLAATDSRKDGAAVAW